MRWNTCVFQGGEPCRNVKKPFAFFFLLRLLHPSLFLFLGRREEGRVKHRGPEIFYGNMEPNTKEGSLGQKIESERKQKRQKEPRKTSARRMEQQKTTRRNKCRWRGSFREREKRRFFFFPLRYIHPFFQLALELEHVAAPPFSLSLFLDDGSTRRAVSERRGPKNIWCRTRQESNTIDLGKDKQKPRARRWLTADSRESSTQKGRKRVPGIMKFHILNHNEMN